MRVSMVARPLAGACLAAALVLTAVPGHADESIADHDLTGDWYGEAIFMLPGGMTDQEHHFVFKSEGGAFYSGEHSWAIPKKNLQSHDGKHLTYEATEPFMGVVGVDGDLWLVEIGDTTSFVLHLVDADTLVFVGMEGGDHPVVGRGELKRKK